MSKILLVDDSEVDRRLVSGMLNKEEQYEVTFAENGEEALAAMKSGVPDLVVTDLFMPHLDGLELVSRARREFPLVPVILITSKGNEEIAVEALHRGAASYVPKRLLGRYLMDTVASVLAAAHERKSRAKLLGSMQSNASEFSLENDTRLVPLLVGYFLESMSHIGIGDETERLRASVALDEALRNAIHHGNLEVGSALRERDDNAYYDLIKQRQRQPPYCHRRVQVKVMMTDSEARFVIRDEGRGFNVAELPDPADPANLEKAAGRGILLMRTFMDEVNYNGTGNQVTMIKRSEIAQAEQQSSKVFRAGVARDVLIVTVLGNVTTLTDEDLAGELEQLVRKLDALPVRHVVIDLEAVTRFGSSFLECIRRIWTVARAREGKVVLCNVSDLGREILALSKFDSVWDICTTRDEALASLIG